MPNPWDNDPVVGGKTSSPAEFAQVYGPAAERAAKTLNVDPKVLLGQWGLETGWGKSIIPGTNNLGNIKDFAGGGVGATDNMTGSRDKYRAYATPEEFADDFASLIQRKYPNAVGAKDPLAFATALKQGGYAEDPRYVDKVAQATRMAGSTPNPVVAAFGKAVEAVVPSAQAAGNPWDNDPIVETAAPAKAQEPGKSGVQTVMDTVSRVASPAGAVLNAIRGDGPDRQGIKGFASGLADLGNTILNNGQRVAKGAPAGPALLTDQLPRITPEENAQRASGLKDFNRENAGAAFSAGRLAGNIAATAPLSGAAGAGVAAAGLPRLGQAISSGGMSTGGAAPGLAAGAVDLGTRMAGGAISGGLTAGAVDPSQAGTGAMIGAAMPPVVQGLGAAGRAVGRTLRGPEVPPNVLAAAAQGREAGYVIPPTQANPTLTNRLLEGFSGKITTAQNASARNQGVTNELAKKAINAPELTPEGLASVRAQANKAYDALGQSAPFQADDAFRASLERAGASSKQLKADFPELVNKDVDSLVEGLAGRAEFDAQSTIEAIKRLRSSASANKIGTDPEKKALGQVQAKVSAALEELVERNLQAQGNPEALQAYRAARQTLAKTYDIEKALNPASGNVDANKLAQLLKKGRPLTDELNTIAQFSSAFPKATQTVEKMGSLPQTSPLDWGALGIGSAVTGNPLMMAGVLARPAARSMVLSPMVQNRLTQASNRLPITSEELSLLAPLVRAAPLSGTSQSGR